MPKIKSFFTQGIMDAETDKAFVEQGRFRSSESMRFNTNGGNDGVGVNIKGTEEVANETQTFNENVINVQFKCVTAYYNENKDAIYYLLASPDGVISKICEYNIFTKQSSVIAEDNQSILKLQKNGYITGIDEIDGLLFWSEWGNNPRRINVERAKTWAANGYSEDDLMVIVKPPLDKLKITLQDSGEEENNIEEKFLSFSYRYRYLDNEYSVLAPFTEFAFFPEDFKYNYAQQHTKSMINKFNQVKIEFNTGNERVKEIQLVFKESESNSEWIIDDFDKESLGYDHNETKTFLFDNSKVYRALSDNVIRNYFDNVPRTAKAQTMIDGRLIYAHYLEGYNLLDLNGNKINVDFKLNHLFEEDRKLNPNGLPQSLTRQLSHVPEGPSLSLINELLDGFSWLDYAFVVGQEITKGAPDAGEYTVVSATVNTLVLLKTEAPFPNFQGSEVTGLNWIEDKYVPSLEAKKTIKSIRDYEVGVLYLDGHGRSTPVLVSKTNTLNIPVRFSDKANKIQVELKNNPPAFAEKFRFFIKQNRLQYDYILPSLFYEDGVYRWIKLEESDKDKIKEGDYLIVKSDTQSIQSTLKKTKVLEIKEQEKNFLSPIDTVDTITQRAGLYFKTQPDGFRLNTDDYAFYQFNAYHNSRARYHNNVQGVEKFITEASFYGSGENDLTALGVSTLATNTDKHFIVEIDGDSTPNTFAWSIDEGASWEQQNIGITAATEYNLSDGIKITFDSATGHEIGDQWSIYASGGITTDNAKAYSFFRTAGDLREFEATDARERDVITEGAQIDLVYDEYNRGNVFWELNLIASKQYPNIMEWFYGDNVAAQIKLKKPDFKLHYIMFARGHITGPPDGSVTGPARTFVRQESLFMTMIMKSQNSETAVKWVKLATETTVFQAPNSNQRIILETEGKLTAPEVYFEIGKTYDIVDGKHKADLDLFPNDQHQTLDDPLKVTLDWHNAFSYGNSIESYKIKDDFNTKGLQEGIRVLTSIKDEYGEIKREADITWSDIYEDELKFNGLSSFNQSLINFIKLDKEQGSIQKLVNDAGNLLVLQENIVGRLPYNKNIIYDTEGSTIVGVSTNVLDRKSYQAYDFGRYGTKHPESVQVWGNRKYFVDQANGVAIRLSTDGITPVSQIYLLDKDFSDQMDLNKKTFLVGGYDPKHSEYLINMNVQNPNNVQKFRKKTLAFKEKAKGFPTYYPFDPDFMLYADKELYSWKNGRMYKHNATNKRNNFYGQQHPSKITFFVNQEFSVEKIWKAIGLESSHAWDMKISTKLTSKFIDKAMFEKFEDYYYTEIKGNTNNNLKANSVFGLGRLNIINGEIITSVKFATLSVGDHIIVANNTAADTVPLSPNKVVQILPNKIVLENPTNVSNSFLMYSKNQALDGSSIRGDILEVEMTINTTEKVELRAVSFEVAKSEHS